MISSCFDIDKPSQSFTLLWIHPYQELIHRAISFIKNAKGNQHPCAFDTSKHREQRNNAEKSWAGNGKNSIPVIKKSLDHAAVAEKPGERGLIAMM